MNRTRKVFCLLLCLVMVMGMFTFGASADGEDQTYVKVTVDLSDWSGNYLIVYEADETSGTAFNGSLTTLDTKLGHTAIEISDSSITGDYQSISFTIAAVTGGYSIQSASGYYIGKTSDANGMDSKTDTEYVNTIAFDGTDLKITSSGGAVLRFNASSSECRFRYYKSSTYTNQKAIALYRLDDGSEPDVDPVENAIDKDGTYIALTLNSLELQEYTYIRHFVSTSETVTAATAWGLQYWTPEDYAALTLSDGEPAFDAEPTKTCSFIETNNPTGDDDQYYATTGGIVAAKINEVQYVRAYITIGNDTYYTPVEAYGVANYLQAVADSADYGVDSPLYDVVEALIAYGTAAAAAFG